MEYFIIFQGIHFMYANVYGLSASSLGAGHLLLKNITLGEAICSVCDLEAPPQVTSLEELYVVVRFILERKLQPKCCEAIMLHCSKKPIRFIATCFLRMMLNDHNECLRSSISKFQLSLSETSPYKLPIQV
ncbi:hypothetical protein D5086_006063 [Populus alba]|uniref:Uncharacterized protein n=1 Tax=Populus alba TaxID=43335 RepID=A0ACC4CJF0_POPAL